MRFKRFISIALPVLLVMSFADLSLGYVETAVKFEYDSNISRSLTNKESDMIVSSQILFQRQPSGDSRLEWVYGASLKASGYSRYVDMSFVEASTSGGLVYHLNPKITAELTLQLQGQVVGDSDQSVLSVATNAAFVESIAQGIQLSQYYSCRWGFAKEDTYSYGLQSAGLTSSFVITKKMTLEAAYEFAYGDSFRALEQTTVGGMPWMMHGNPGFMNMDRRGGRNSSVFNQLVIKEKVSRNTVGAAINYDLSNSWSASVRYSFSTANGSSGVSNSHNVSLLLGLRF